MPVPWTMPAQRMRRLLPAVLAVVLLPALAGCLGGQQRTEWAYDDAGLDALAATGRTGRGVTIAVLDTGINTRHPSLDHLVDDDPANGQLVAFRDFLGNAIGPNEAFDDAGHGSHVVGILAARGSSTKDKLVYGGIDLKGGAPDALFVVGRVCDELCDAAILPDAVRWAVDQGADVISMSLGGQFSLGDLPQTVALQQAIDEAVDAGVVVVASAGNRGEDPSSEDVESPADMPGVIAVGAIGSDGRVAPFSSRGSASENQCRVSTTPLPPVPVPGLPSTSTVTGRCHPDQKPELVAPGVDILSAWSGGDYVRASGTSQATPFVTAAIALLLQDRADLASRADVEALKEALVRSAAPVEGQTLPHDVAAGYGRLDAAAALRAYGVA